MRLALSQYLRTLRERDEFDRLLPELLAEMDYVPLVKPKAGIRQFGVDFPAVGKSPDDGIDELLLFVIKQGDITRGVWNGGVDKVRESIEEVLDVYLDAHVPPEYRIHRKVIVLATTGDLSQDVQPNWAGFASKHPEVVFRFWGADRVAELLETHLLDEHLFDAEDRADLRKSLALAGDSEYGFADFCRLLLRQLGLEPDGALSGAGAAQDPKALLKALRRVHLAAMVCAHWAEAEGERRQALWVMERAILWAFHRAQLQQLKEIDRIMEALADIWWSYAEVAHRYYEHIAAHLHVKDGLSGYTREGAEYAISLFEQVGILATIGLGQAALHTSDAEDAANYAENARVVADALSALIENHAATGSPRLDHQVVDVSLALLLLYSTGRVDAAKTWLRHLAGRLNFAFLAGRLFPVGTDSLDDLVELDSGTADEDLKTTLKQTSWLLATIASWCAAFGLDDEYRNLAGGYNNRYPEVGAQLWHPAKDWSRRWYFGRGQFEDGVTEAPYPLPEDAEQLRARIAQFNAERLLVWEEASPARAVGIWALDFVACRHFRTPVPASMWYRLVKAQGAESDVGSTARAGSASSVEP